MLGIKPVALKTSIEYLLTKSGNRVTKYSLGTKTVKSVINNGVDSIEKEYSVTLLKNAFFNIVNGYCNSVKIIKNGKYQSETFITHNIKGDIVSILKHEPSMPSPTEIFVAKKK